MDQITLNIQIFFLGIWILNMAYPWMFEKFLNAWSFILISI